MNNVWINIGGSVWSLRVAHFLFYILWVLYLSGYNIYVALLIIPFSIVLFLFIILYFLIIICIISFENCI